MANSRDGDAVAITTTPSTVGRASVDLSAGENEVRRALLELAIDAAGIGTFNWNVVRNQLLWDDKLIEMFGYDRDGFDQTIEAFNARLHPDDLARVTAALERSISNGDDFESEYRIVTPNQRTRWISARGRVVRDDTGNTLRLLGAAWDTTSRVSEEAGVARGIETMSTPFLSFDESWCFSYVNAEAERVLGYSRKDLLGGNIWELFPAITGSTFETNYRHTMETGEPTAFDAYYPDPLNAWFEIRAWRNVDGVSVSFLDVTARHVAHQSALRAEERATILSRITEELSATLDAEEASKRLAKLIVPAIADWCIVTLITDGSPASTRQGLRNVSCEHRDESMQPVLEAYAQDRLKSLLNDSFVESVIEHGQMQFIERDATAMVHELIAPGPSLDRIERLAPEAALVLPLTGREGNVGMLTLARDQARGTFEHEDVVTAKHIAARAGLVMDNARLHRQQREIAEGLQRSLLSDPVEPNHLQIVVRYVPAYEAARVGGDWYDAFLQPGGTTMLVIGDVVGHDMQAASEMGQVRSIVRTLGAVSDDNPAGVLQKTDKVMESLRISATATAIVARLEQPAHDAAAGTTRLRFSNAGHPSPMLIDAAGNAHPLLTTERDPLLGVTPNAERAETEVTLGREATVLLYTDGLVERRGQPIDAGIERLQATLQELAGDDLETMCDRLLEAMLPESSDDDVALIAVKLHDQNGVQPPPDFDPK